MTFPPINIWIFGSFGPPTTLLNIGFKASNFVPIFGLHLILPPCEANRSENRRRWPRNRSHLWLICLLVSEYFPFCSLPNCINHGCSIIWRTLDVFKLQVKRDDDVINHIIEQLLKKSFNFWFGLWIKPEIFLDLILHHYR